MPSKTPRNNAEWLAALGNGEAQAEALADLREYLRRAVFLYLDRHRADLAHLDLRELEHLAEDCVQDALLRILDKLDTFRGESKFTTWAYRFVINVAAGELRLHRWRTVSIETLVGEHEVPLFTFLGDRQSPDPETMAARNQILDTIHQIINEELTERQQLALVNVHLRGIAMADVARQLDSTPNTVYKLLHDARKKIKAGLHRRRYSEADVLAIFGEM